MNPATIEKMITESTFSVPELTLHLPELGYAVNIELCFPSLTKLEEGKSFSISGFPRQLAMERKSRG